MNNKGIAPIAIVLLVIAGMIAIGAGAFYYSHNSSTPVPAGIPPTNNNSSTITATSGEPISPGTQPSVPPSSPTSTTAATLTPQSGPVGTVITIHGHGFATTGNMVTIDGLVSASLKDLSSNGNTIVFTMPSSLGPNCKPNQACPQFLMEVTAHTYTVAVISPSGATQAVGTFTVTGTTHLPM